MNLRSRLVFMLTLLSATLLVQGQQLYKHQDKEGRITYSDRPDSADEGTVDIGPPNVTTPEATRQINEILQRQRAKEALRLQRQEESNESAARATQALEAERQQHNEEFPATSVLQPEVQPQADDSAPQADDSAPQPVADDPAPAPNPRGDGRDRDSDARTKAERERRERNEHGQRPDRDSR